MKTVIFLLLMSAFSSAQIAYFSGGANYFSTSSSGLDKFAERYNTTRARILTQKMEAPGSTTGWFINGGGAVSLLSFELGYSYNNATMKSGTDPILTTGGGTGRDIDLAFHNFWFGTGLAVASNENIGLIFPTFEADVMNINFETRTNTENERGELGTIAIASIGCKILIAFSGGIGLMINPVYSFNLLDINFGELYKKTNTAYNDLSDESKGSLGGFQMRAGLMFYIAN